MNATNNSTNMLRTWSMLFILGIFLIIFSGQSTAYPSGHIGLLTVSESNASVEKGGTADLYLEIRPGTGKIFIDSFPLSKVDTQITTRFASELACDFLDRDCSNYDFFYTITANSALVGGPSAGAATTVLAIAVLDGQELDNRTIMTGTINSGNLIGPVAGINAKALAAQEKGYLKVLVPKWDLNVSEEDEWIIDIIPVSTLEDALYEFTGKNYSSANAGVIKSDNYDAIMKQVTIDLCSKYGTYADGQIVMPNLSLYVDNINSSNDNFAQALDAIDAEAYYSAASFCFGGNVKIATQLLENLTGAELKVYYIRLLQNVTEYEQKIDKESMYTSTLSELETYVIVNERLHDAKDILYAQSANNISYEDVAYAQERFATAIIWSRFFEMPGQKFILNEDLLKSVCMKKLSEAEERLNYLELYFEKPDIRKDLSRAYSYYNQNEYALCIFKASNVKADSDVVLSALFVSTDSIGELFDEKIGAAQKVISKQQEKNIFPILGYSYYEYAKSLEDTNTYSALLYAEYSLELSNIDMYFEKKPLLTLPEGVDFLYVYAFVAGLVIGAVILAAILVPIFLRKKVVKKRR